MTFKHQVSVIGTGAVGTALVRALHEKGIFVSGLFNRTKSVADKLADLVEAETTAEFPESLEFLGQICFICVPDDLISEVADKISSFEGDYSKVAFVHTSGAKSASVLNHLNDKGSATAAFHPLQTFNSFYSKGIFKDCYISLQGEDLLIRELKALVELLGARYLVVSEQQKAGLHLSAVFACNYLVALMEAARQSLHLTEPEIDVIEVMKPLITKTWNNIIEKGVNESLTGPVSRGDGGTVKEHLNMLQESSRLTSIYTELGSVALDIAGRKGLEQEKIKKLQRILDDASRKTNESNV